MIGRGFPFCQLVRFSFGKNFEEALSLVTCGLDSGKRRLLSRLKEQACGDLQRVANFTEGCLGKANTQEGTTADIGLSS
jgi:hypothetical protein